MNATHDKAAALKRPPRPAKKTGAGSPPPGAHNGGLTPEHRRQAAALFDAVMHAYRVRRTE